MSHTQLPQFVFLPFFFTRAHQSCRPTVAFGEWSTCSRVELVTTRRSQHWSRCSILVDRIDETYNPVLETYKPVPLPTTTHTSALLHTAAHCRTLLHTAAHCQYCRTLPHTAAHCHAHCHTLESIWIWWIQVDSIYTRLSLLAKVFHLTILHI
jgi:hypothetical protein